MKTRRWKKVIVSTFICGIIIFTAVFFATHQYIKNNAIRHAVYDAIIERISSVRSMTLADKLYLKGEKISPFFSKRKLQKITLIEVDLIYDRNYKSDAVVNLSEIGKLKSLKAINIRDSIKSEQFEQAKYHTDYYEEVIEDMPAVEGLDQLPFEDGSISFSFSGVRISNNTDLSCAGQLRIDNCDLSNYQWLSTCKNLTTKIKGFSPNIYLFEDGNREINNIDAKVSDY